MAAKKSHRILVFRMGAMGDILFTTSALRGLRKKYPDSHIEYACLPKWKVLLRGNPNVDHVSGVAYYHMKALGSLARKKWDILINLQEGEKAARLCMIIPALERRGNIIVDGVLAAAEGGYFISREPKDRLRQSREGVSIPESFCRAAGVQMDDGHFDFYPEPRAERKVLRFLKKNDLTLGPKPIAIHSFSRGSESRSWSFEKVKELVLAFPEENFVFISTKKDISAIDLQDLPTNVVPFMGDLSKLAVLLRNCGLFVGTDSGPRHMASAMGVPIVWLCGATHPNIVPLRPREVPVLLPDDCHPCFLEKCPQKEKCLDRIPIEEIVQAMKTVLRGPDSV
ncbi:MAG: glycosyltransferase family 9 protein [Candidatus Sumerlaeia bacterium]